jgi:hypothetical protein
METNKNVTIEKWHSGSNIYYWIVNTDGKAIDGFSLKRDAVQAIKRWGLNLVSTTIITRK